MVLLRRAIPHVPAEDFVYKYPEENPPASWIRVPKNRSPTSIKHANFTTKIALKYGKMEYNTDIMGINYS